MGPGRNVLTSFHMGRYKNCIVSDNSPYFLKLRIPKQDNAHLAHVISTSENLCKSVPWRTFKASVINPLKSKYPQNSVSCIAKLLLRIFLPQHRDQGWGNKINKNYLYIVPSIRQKKKTFPLFFSSLTHAFQHEGQSGNTVKFCKQLEKRMSRFFKTWGRWKMTMAAPYGKP